MQANQDLEEKIIEILSAHPFGMSQRELAREMGLSVRTTGELIASLRQEGRIVYHTILQTEYWLNKPEWVGNIPGDITYFEALIYACLLTAGSEGALKTDIMATIRSHGIEIKEQQMRAPFASLATKGYLYSRPEGRHIMRYYLVNFGPGKLIPLEQRILAVLKQKGDQGATSGEVAHDPTIGESIGSVAKCLQYMDERGLVKFALATRLGKARKVWSYPDFELGPWQGDPQSTAILTVLENAGEAGMKAVELFKALPAGMINEHSLPDKLRRLESAGDIYSLPDKSRGKPARRWFKIGFGPEKGGNPGDFESLGQYLLYRYLLTHGPIIHEQIVAAFAADPELKNYKASQITGLTSVLARLGYIRQTEQGWEAIAKPPTTVHVYLGLLREKQRVVIHYSLPVEGHQEVVTFLDV